MKLASIARHRVLDLRSTQFLSHDRRILTRLSQPLSRIITPGSISVGKHAIRNIATNKDSSEPSTTSTQANSSDPPSCSASFIRSKTDKGGILEGWKVGDDGVTREIPFKDLPLSQSTKRINQNLPLSPAVAASSSKESVETPKVGKEETCQEIEEGKAPLVELDTRDKDRIVSRVRQSGEGSLTQVKDGIKDDVSHVIGPSKVLFRPRPGFRSYKEERHDPSAVFRQQKREKKLVYFVILCGLVATFHYKFKEAIDCTGNMAKITSPNQIFALRLIFGRCRSRFTGWLMEQYVPVSLRAGIYELFARIYNVKLDEIRYPLEAYQTFQDFFSRSLRDGVIKIDEKAKVTSPVDGTVMALGTIDGPAMRLPQIKGADYDISAFLGVDPYMLAQYPTMARNLPTSKKGEGYSLDFTIERVECGVRSTDIEMRGTGWSQSALKQRGKPTEEDNAGWLQTEKAEKHKKPKKLGEIGEEDLSGYYPEEGLCIDPSTKSVRYAVLYLAPGDYHRFHSPCSDFIINCGKHFAGEVFPVARWLVDKVADLFTVNERLVLSGVWEYGQMHMTTVAAYNVGNIWLDFDKKLKTNYLRHVAHYVSGDVTTKHFTTPSRELRVQKGELVGGFKLGSTVVLVFDADPSMEWLAEEGQQIRVGQPLCGFSAPSTTGSTTAGSTVSDAASESPVSDSSVQ